YTQELIKYRKYLFSRAQHEGMMVSLAEILHRSEICWHGVNPYSPDWDANSHSLAMTAISLDVKVAIYIVFNAYWAPLQFNLPLPPQNINGNWHRIVDTALPSPLDIIPLGNPLPEIQGHYLVAPRSACLFVCGGFLQQSR
ncbi:MAG: glycogen debranching enzyme, partial [Aeromonadaceae bacterium]|nr:glycogen debranching enzyme [Aeromonadaceae bacterium]